MPRRPFLKCLVTAVLSAGVIGLVGGEARALSVDSISPAFGPTAGGTTVTITGTGLETGLNFTQIAVGVAHTCGIASTGSVYCWGGNSNGQLGDGTNTSQSEPVKVKTAADDAGSALPANIAATAVVAGTQHSCVLAGNDIYCWGYNPDGQLGNNTTTDSSLPVKVQKTTDNPSSMLPGDVTVTAMDSGAHSTCVVASDNNIYCWGWNLNGQLGNNGTADSPIPTRVRRSNESATFELPSAASVSIVSLSVGASHACVVASDNNAYCWGGGYYGQMGDNTRYSTTTYPVRVYKNSDNASSALPASATLTAISASQRHTCVLASNEVYCWGNGSYGQMGNGTSVLYNTLAKRVLKTSDNASSALPDGVTIERLVSTFGGSCVLASDNNIYCWGYGVYGEMGNGTAIFNNLYVTRVFKTSDDADSALPDSASIATLTAGGDGVCTTTTAQKAYCWGSGANGQMGNGTTVANNLLPVLVGQELPITVTFDAGGVSANCTNVVVAPDGNSLTCTTPSHLSGLVSITISNGLQTDTLPAIEGMSGFYYTDAPLPPNSGFGRVADRAVQAGWLAFALVLACGGGWAAVRHARNHKV
ncbi:MAG: IPT/TIG domain-containing protein [Candidatus Nomurabacteria bacterium]|jgi:alpha-tubulin suppressor-like RCC1 family protein|nr:IPT/TIG domain-containing protein [Candidatus Nomurabacteria bacterium]